MTGWGVGCMQWLGGNVTRIHAVTLILTPRLCKTFCTVS